MTAPRQVLPGRNYLLTRRCTQRQSLLRPDSRTNRIIMYCVAEAASRFGIQAIAWCAMSNHWHAVVYDPLGNLPAFLQRFHRHTAMALNHRWNRRENLWATEQPSAVRLVERDDVLDKVVYTLANPVAANLVDRVFDWPGASSLVHMNGRPLTLKRPKAFFRERGSMPEEITLVVTPPPGWQHDQVSWVERVRAGVREKETAARQWRSANNQRVVGRRNVLRASELSQPMKPEPRNRLRPSLACKNTLRRIRELAALREFRHAYARARQRLVAGCQVVFPAGTYMLRLLGVARCEPEPTTAPA